MAIHDMWTKIPIDESTRIADRWIWEPQCRTAKQRYAKTTDKMALHIWDFSMQQEKTMPTCTFCDICVNNRTKNLKGERIKFERDANLACYRCPISFRFVCSDINCIDVIRQENRYETFICLTSGESIPYGPVDDDKTSDTNILEIHPQKYAQLLIWKPTIENIQGVWESNTGPIYIKEKVVFNAAKSLKDPRFFEKRGNYLFLMPDNMKLMDSKVTYNTNSTKYSISFQNADMDKPEHWSRTILPSDPLGVYSDRILRDNIDKSPRETRTTKLRNEFHSNIKESCDALIKSINIRYPRLVPKKPKHQKNFLRKPNEDEDVVTSHFLDTTTKTETTH